MTKDRIRYIGAHPEGRKNNNKTLQKKCQDVFGCSNTTSAAGDPPCFVDLIARWDRIYKMLGEIDARMLKLNQENARVPYQRDLKLIRL